MRTVMMALVVAGLLAAPSLGLINVKLTADGDFEYGILWLAGGQTTTVHVWAQGTAAGIFSLAGDIKATGDTGYLTSDVGSMTFTNAFSPDYLLFPKPGTAAVGGGWSSFGTEQTNWGAPDPTVGRDDYVEVCHYLVTGGNTDGVVTLTFAGKTVSGYKPLEVDKTGVMGTTQSLTFYLNVPEPLTLALLALGGLVAARRRRA